MGEILIGLGALLITFGIVKLIYAAYLKRHR